LRVVPHWRYTPHSCANEIPHALHRAFYIDHRVLEHARHSLADDTDRPRTQINYLSIDLRPRAVLEEGTMARRDEPRPKGRRHRALGGLILHASSATTRLAKICLLLMTMAAFFVGTATGGARPAPCSRSICFPRPRARGAAAIISARVSSRRCASDASRAFAPRHRADRLRARSSARGEPATARPNLEDTCPNLLVSSRSSS